MRSDNKKYFDPDCDFLTSVANNYENQVSMLIICKMRMTKIISIVVTLFLSVTAASGQSILQDYFTGNKDSLVIEASKLINMPEPIFKSLQPTNIDSAL